MLQCRTVATPFADTIEYLSSLADVFVSHSLERRNNLGCLFLFFSHRVAIKDLLRNAWNQDIVFRSPR